MTSHQRLPDWFEQPVAVPDDECRQRALARQQQLTKPAGSLGRLEELAVTLASLQRTDRPAIDQVGIAVFAADHGVAAEGVSAYPQVVTGEMVRNFARGGAAVTVLARQLGARFTVVNVGTVQALEPLTAVVDRRLGPGTANLRRDAAMSESQCREALNVGAETVDELGELDLFVGGEMGIGNTTAAAALGCALLPAEPLELVGCGTGIDGRGLERKRAVVAGALLEHAARLTSPLAVLRHLGGFEIAALAGAYIRCAQRGVPVLVDGFICTAAALVALRLNPGLRPWLLFSHCSVERGHRRLIEFLDAKPLLDLGLRLGEGSGAAAAVPLLRMACALHNEMASFAAAGVSRG